MVPSVTTSQVTVPVAVLTAGKDLPARKVNEEKLLNFLRLVFTFLRTYFKQHLPFRCFHCNCPMLFYLSYFSYFLCAFAWTQLFKASLA